MPVLNGKALILERAGAIHAVHRQIGARRAELDLSGGIDSAVMLGLLVEALGPDNLTVVHSRIDTNPEQTARAVALAKALGVKLINIDLGGVFSLLTGEMNKALLAAGYDFTPIGERLDNDPTILGSIRSCLRAPVGRGFNRITGNGIRHGTGNECEDRFLRFYQKGGDGEVDSNPIAMLSKTEVFQLAYALGEHFPQAREVYRAHIRAKPSADLWGTGDAHNDEDEIRSYTGVEMTYGRINPDTGEVLKVGTIERVARFLDQPCPVLLPHTNEDVLFGREGAVSAETLLNVAVAAPSFTGFSRDQIEGFLNAARNAEFKTRHKLNPNIPTYGTRKGLVAAGILTDTLPAETSAKTAA